MCFRINPKIRIATHKTVYKVVGLNKDGYLKSLIYGNICWSYPGAVQKCDRGPSHETKQRICQHRLSMTYYSNEAKYALHGIYVFTTMAKAREQARHSDYLILKLLVKPEHFLHQSADGTEATYKEVTIAVNQPDITWYD